MNLKKAAELRSEDSGSFSVRKYKSYEGRNPEKQEIL